MNSLVAPSGPGMYAMYAQLIAPTQSPIEQEPFNLGPPPLLQGKNVRAIQAKTAPESGSLISQLFSFVVSEVTTLFERLVSQIPFKF